MPAPAIAPELSTADDERFAQPVSAAALSTLYPAVAGWPVVWPVARRVLKERDAAPGYPTGWPIFSPAGQFSAPCYQPAFFRRVRYLRGAILLGEPQQSRNALIRLCTLGAPQQWEQNGQMLQPGAQAR